MTLRKRNVILNEVKDLGHADLIRRIGDSYGI
jgi:hypothetical protein